MTAHGQVTFQTRVPVLHIGGGLSLKAVFNFGSKRESDCDRICAKVEKIHRIVADQANYIHPDAMAAFLDFVNRFIEARMLYYGHRDEHRPSRFFNAQSNELKERAENLIELGTAAYREGIAVSTVGSGTKSQCQIYHHDPPVNSKGRCLLCFPDLPVLESSQETRAFLTWEAYLESLKREGILIPLNQTRQVAGNEESPATPGPPHPGDTREMANSPAVSDYLGLEEVSEAEIPSMWQAFSSIFIPKRRRGNSTIH